MIQDRRNDATSGAILTDREPASCGYEQLERPVSFRLADVLSPDGSVPPPIVTGTVAGSMDAGADPSSGE